MNHNLCRSLYRTLVRMHPAPFRQQFEEEMFWIFEQGESIYGAASLVADAGVSLGRQWLLRSGLWKWVMAGVGGVIPLIIAFGSFLPWDKPLCR
jgi:hypothetical protein